MEESDDVLFKRLTAAAAQVLETKEGRIFIAALLQECEYEEPAFGTNAAIMASKVAKQEIAHKVKNWCWYGGGKKNWRTMEDEIDISTELAEN